ncbi:hypothetical protein [Anaerovibrio sp.]|uniref:hypothetical protein n=1 Tax=Anaerovibrio sp. TaxID=1872532 RepID=UPI00388F4E2E
MANLMKKILLVIMSILLLMCVVGCGAEGDDEIEVAQDREITLRKNGEAIKATREELYEKAFEDCKWEFTKDYYNQQKQGIVVVKGKINVLGKELNVIVPFHPDKQDGWNKDPSVSVNNNDSEPSYYLEMYIKNKYVDNDMIPYEVLLAWEWRDQFSDKDIKLTDKQIEALYNRGKKNDERMKKGSELAPIIADENETIKKILKEWGKF